MSSYDCREEIDCCCGGNDVNPTRKWLLPAKIGRGGRCGEWGWRRWWYGGVVVKEEEVMVVVVMGGQAGVGAKRPPSHNGWSNNC